MENQERYISFLNRLKTDIADARLKATLTVNEQLLQLYWRIGRNINYQRNKEGWGTKIIGRLSSDLKKAFPDMRGISARNLKYMQSFAEAYPMFTQKKVVETGSSAILQVPLAKLPWYHHITLLDKIKDANERFFYINETIKYGWSRNLMVHQIESGLYTRQGLATTNFDKTLPASQSELAQEIFKDPYKFDFLSMADVHLEKDLENGLVDHMTKFLLELGNGFSFVGRQYLLNIGGEDFFIDLLFYHLKLRCFVVVELKTGKFVPEFAGKLNFYLNVVDSEMKHESDQPSIGILICKEKNHIVAEYALRGISKPIGVSEYNLTKAVPSELRGSLPAVNEIVENLSSE